MKVSYKWIRDYVSATLAPQELAERLTMAGLEAGDIETIGDDWDNVFIGRVTDVGKHPNADRLSLATIDLGQETHTVVCGAPNIQPGQMVPFATLGARLIDGHTGQRVTLKAAKIRGVVSEGMVCSEQELGISDNHEGIMVLPGGAPVGVPLSQYLGDAVFDVAITPNRPDCLSIIGIGREVAALAGQKITLPAAHYDEHDPPTAEAISVEIRDADLCPRYCAGLVVDAHIGPSPHWMQERLLAAGMRPINNIVDITNFVMLEYGQPLHAFDYQGIGGKKIIVRRAQTGERLVTIDGQERQLSQGMLVIADQSFPIAIAGVMGGAESEVTERTTSILVESANFSAASVRRTAFQLGLTSEASIRFDKGLSAELPMPALRRAITLMVELASAKPSRGIVDVFPGHSTPRGPILLTQRRAADILGIDFGMPRIKAVLESLGFVCEDRTPTELLVSVPYWRTDVRIPDDLIEEAARIIGYDEIPTAMLSSELPRHQPATLAPARERVRDMLVGYGMQEIITYSLAGLDILQKSEYRGQSGSPLRLANPMSREQEYLRTSLTGGLLSTFAANERHQDKGVMLFEIGMVYFPRGTDLPEEREMLAGVMGGPHHAKSWLTEPHPLGFFSAKGILEALLDQLGIQHRFEPVDDAVFLSGRTARILANGQVAGLVGEVHPDVLADFDIVTAPVCVFQIELQKVTRLAARDRHYRPIPRFPPTDRDLALVVDAAVPSEAVQSIIRSFPEVSRATLFDVYTGEQVPAGKKSLAFAVRYQSVGHTLTDEDVAAMQHRILERISGELGGTLR